MPTIATSELPIPKSWDEFEDICADLFALIWNDHNTVRYARTGQRQNGVDIRGRLPAGGIAGVQCKRKRRWPVRKLTKADIDKEVAEALNFTPPLSEFTITTTALNDGALAVLLLTTQILAIRPSLLTIGSCKYFGRARNTPSPTS